MASLMRVRAFQGLSARPAAAAGPSACRVRVSALVPATRLRICTHAAGQEEQASSSTSTTFFATTSIALSAFALAVQSARAEDAPLDLFDAAAAAQSAAGVETAKYGVEDFLVTLLFGVVITLLAVVTAGVAYINIKQFLDNRQEKQDREGVAPQLQAASSSSSSKAGGKASAAAEEEVVIPIKRATRIKKEKGKGFAEFNTRR